LSVASSSSVTRDVHSRPERIATGSAPQTPIRQPASIVMPAPSATSSSVCPGLGATRVFSGTNVTSGALAARRASVRTPTPWIVPAGGATGPLARSRNGFSIRSVRTSHVAASAIAQTRASHVSGSGRISLAHQ
jgi:hypothetical protein